MSRPVRRGAVGKGAGVKAGHLASRLPNVLCAEDRRANDCAVAEGERILSAYRLLDGTKLWVITEWDRSATTILRPDEY